MLGLDGLIFLSMDELEDLFASTFDQVNGPISHDLESKFCDDLSKHLRLVDSIRFLN
jgi:hypothetical protein